MHQSHHLIFLRDQLYVLWECFGGGGAPPFRGMTFTTCRRNLKTNFIQGIESQENRWLVMKWIRIQRKQLLAFKYKNSVEIQCPNAPSFFNIHYHKRWLKKKRKKRSHYYNWWQGISFKLIKWRKFPFQPSLEETSQEYYVRF